MHDSPRNLKRQLITLAISVGVVTLTVGVSVAFASLIFSGTGITGDSNSTVDATGTITIGASQATGITIGRSGITASFPGTVTITGTTTSIQNLVISGTCTGCGVGNFSAGGDLSGSSTSQTVVGIQGKPVSSTAPSVNQALTWNGSFWTPANVSSTGGITAINGLVNSTTSFVGAGTVTVSTSSPNIITITGTGSGSITINSLTTSTFQIQGTANQITVATSSPNIISLSLPQSIATASAPTFGGLVLNGNATTTNLTIMGLGSSGTPCLSVNIAGNVATTTCGGGSSQWTTSSTVIYYNGGNVGIGISSPNALLTVGSSSGFTVDGSGDVLLTTIRVSPSDDRVVIGNAAGQNDAGNESAVDIGYASAENATSDTYSVHIGRHSCSNCAGADAVQIGHAASQYGFSSSEAVSIGYLADQNYNQNAGNDTYGAVHIGANAGIEAVQTPYSVMIGDTAGGNAASAWDSVLLGPYAAENATGTLDNSVMIGNSAGMNANSKGSIFIGQDAGENLSTNNRLVIDSNPTYAASGTTALIYGEFDNRVLRFNATTTSLTGKLGIGTTTPATQLSVAGTSTLNGLILPNLLNAPCLITDGNGDVGSGSCSGGGGGTPGGSNTQIQYNNSNAFAGDANFTWNYATAQLTIASSSGSFLLGTSTLPANALFAVAAPSNIFTILNSGKVGIGTFTPSSALSVIGSGATNGSTALTVLNSAGTSLLNVDDAGNVAISNGASAGASSGAVAIGSNASSSSSGAVAIGNSAIASNSGAVSLGQSAGSSGNESVAIGPNSNASGATSVAVGRSSYAQNTDAVAFGSKAQAANTGSAAIGFSTEANANYAVAIGSGLSSGTQMDVSTANMIGLGDNSTIPTLVITGGSGAGTYGNVGIGTSAPATQLQIAASSTIRLGVSSTAYTGCIEMYDSVNTATLEYIYTASGVLTATTTKPSFCQ